jgi:hypothetical protein
MEIVQGRQGAGEHGRERLQITIAERRARRKEKGK